MTDQVSFRAATAAEIPTLVSLDARIFPSGDAFTEEQYAWFDNYFIENDAGLVVGSVSFASDMGFWDSDVKPPFQKGTHFMASIGVLPHAQHAGIGSASMRWSIDQARSRGQKRVLSCCRARNKPSIALHRKFHFTLSCFIDGFYELPDDDALVYELRLTH